MELTLTADQELFADATERFLGANGSISAVRALRNSDEGFERDYWRQGAALGWTSLLTPEHLGGGSISGEGVVDVTIVADAFGRHAAPGPLLPANVVAAAIARAGTDEQRAELLPGILSGETLPAWCAGPPAASGGNNTGIVARLDGDCVVLDGVQAPVEAANQADVLLVTARSDAGLTQLLVDRNVSGVSITPLQSLDVSRRFGRVDLHEVRVPVSAMLGVSGEAASDVERQLQLALVLQSAESVGAAQRVFDFTLQWAFERYSFGRPLASYQEIKHRFADMKMGLEASHAIATAAARSVQHESVDAAATVSIAAAYVGEVLPELAQDCVQLHGGIGVTYDHDIHLFLRRITVNRVLHGTPADHRQRVTSLREQAA